MFLMLFFLRFLSFAMLAKCLKLRRRYYGEVKPFHELKNTEYIAVQHIYIDIMCSFIHH